MQVKVGDRVRVVGDPESWKQPWRRLISQGRPATVKTVYGGGQRVSLRFDSKRKGNMELDVDNKDLGPLEE